mgnify:CR=1 FL=1
MKNLINRRAALLSALLFGLTLCVSAQARPSHEQRSDLLLVLNAYEFRVDAQVLRKIGPDVNKLLIEISGDPGFRPRVRNHALMALSAYPVTQTRKYLESLLLEPSLIGTPAGTLIRRQALRSLGKAFRGEVVVPISNLKDDVNPQIRIAVAHALAETQSDRAIPILSAWLPNEKELGVREAVDRALESFYKRGRR